MAAIALIGMRWMILGTPAGTRHFFLDSGSAPESARAGKRRVAAVMRHVAERLGNTAAVIVERYLAGRLMQATTRSPEQRLRALLRTVRR